MEDMPKPDANLVTDDIELAFYEDDERAPMFDDDELFEEHVDEETEYSERSFLD